MTKLKHVMWCFEDLLQLKFKQAIFSGFIIYIYVILIYRYYWQVIKMCILILWVFTNIESMVIWTSEHFDLVSLHLSHCKNDNRFVPGKNVSIYCPQESSVSVAFSGHREFFFRVIYRNIEIMVNALRNKLTVYVVPCAEFLSHTCLSG